MGFQLIFYIFILVRGLWCMGKDFGLSRVTTSARVDFVIKILLCLMGFGEVKFTRRFSHLVGGTLTLLQKNPKFSKNPPKIENFPKYTSEGLVKKNRDFII